MAMGNRQVNTPDQACPRPATERLMPRAPQMGAAERVMEKLAFQREAILRECCCRDSACSDQAAFSLLRREWSEPR
jgi:hypothetical protein